MTSLIVVMSVAMLGAWVIQTQSAVARRQSLSIDTKSSLYVAEAGLAEAAFQVSQGKSGTVGSPEEPARFGSGIYWVESEEGDDGTVSLTSTARAGGSQFCVNLRIKPNLNPVSKLGLFGDEGVVIGDRVLIDGYEADEYRIDQQFVDTNPLPTTESGAVVSSNGDVEVLDGSTAFDDFAIVMNAMGVPAWTNGLDRMDHALAGRYQHALSGDWADSTVIYGLVEAGRDGVILTNGLAHIAETGHRPGKAVLPTVIVPTDLRVNDGDHVIPSGVTREFKDLSIRIRSVVIESGGVLILKGPSVVQAERVIVEAGGVLYLDDSEGPVSFYVTEELRFEDGSVIDAELESKKGHGVMLLMPRPTDPDDDERIYLGMTGDVRGIIYAPGDRVTIPPGLRLYGCAVAKHLTISNGAWITHDRSLEIGGLGFPSLPKRQHWQAIHLTGPLVGPPGFDPVLATRLAGDDAESGADSTPETYLEIIYMDVSDVKATYAGELDAFDVNVAERIMAVRWQDPDTLEFTEWAQPPGASPEDVIGQWRQRIRNAKEAESAAAEAE